MGYKFCVKKQGRNLKRPCVITNQLLKTTRFLKKPPPGGFETESRNTAVVYAM